MVDGGVGGGSGAVVRRRRCVVGSSAMVRRGSMVGCSVVGSGMGRVGRSLSVGGVVGGAGAVVGLAGVGDVCDIARVRVVHVVGHGLMMVMDNSTRLMFC